MNLKPYERFEIISKLAPDEAELKLQSTIVPTPKFNYFPFNTSIYDDYLFRGDLDEKRFNIEPYFNSAIGPRIKGQIFYHDKGCEIKIYMHPTLRSIPLYAMMLIIEAFFVAAALSDQSNIGLPIVFPLICYGAAILIIRRDMAKVKGNLNKIFEVLPDR